MMAYMEILSFLLVCTTGFFNPCKHVVTPRKDEINKARAISSSFRSA